MPTPPGNQPRLNQPRSHGRTALRTAEGRARRVGLWLAGQTGAVPPVLVALDREYRQGRVVVCPPPTEQVMFGVHDMVPTAAGICCELDRLGAVIFGMPVWLTALHPPDTEGGPDGAALWCVDAVRGSAPMLVTIPYRMDSNGSITPGPARFTMASTHPVSTQIGYALGLAFDVAGHPENGPVMRDWLTGHGYGVDAFST